MPAISKIRLTNVQYEQGNKRYNDELFLFDGHNGAILLENGGGKTVFIQTVIQAMVPNGVIAERKVRDTLDVTASPAHIAIEWILKEQPRHYALTCITFYMGKEGLEYFMYAYDYPAADRGRIEALPFVRQDRSGKRTASKEEIKEYYQKMAAASMNARYFSSKQEYQAYLENQFQIVPSEWEAILKINSTEGGVENFFDNCKTTAQLVDHLLIPVVEQGMSGQGTRHFVKIFDNLRQQFREYLTLSEQIKEYQALSGQITTVIDQYALLDGEAENYRALLARVKGLWQKVAGEQQAVQEEYRDIAETETNRQQQERLWQQQFFSLAIARLQAELARQQVLLNDLQIEKEKRADCYQQHHRQLASLEHARLKKNLQDKQAKLQLVVEELAKLDSAPDTRQIKADWQRCLSGIRFLYDQLEAELTRQQELEGQKQRDYRQQLQQTEELTEIKQQQLQQLALKLKGLESDLTNTAAQMQEIAGEILDNPREETVSDQLPRWERRSYRIEEELHQLAEQLVDNKKETATVQADLQTAHGALNAAIKQNAEAGVALAAIDRQAGELLQQLQRLSPRDGDFTSLYLRQAAIDHRLAEERELCLSRREELLAEERVLLRFHDLYKDNQVFTADPALEKWAVKQQNVFLGLQLGSAFLELYLAEHPADDLTVLYRRYPFWPITLVAGSSEIQGVEAQLTGLAGDWTHPILLLTRSEALAAAAGGEGPAERLIMPARWPEFSRQASFQAWLQEQAQRAAEIKEKRQAADELFQQWHSLAGSMKNFWQAYDYETVYQPLKATWAETNTRQKNLTEEIGALDSAGKSLARQKSGLEEKQKTLEAEQANLTLRHRQGLKWQELAEKQRLLLSRIELTGAEGVPLEQELKQLRLAAGACREQLRQVQERISGAEQALVRLQAEDAYAKVRRVSPVPVETTLAGLKEKARVLEDQLRGLQENRSYWERQQTELEQEIAAVEQQIKRHWTEYGEIIDPELVFPPQGETEIDRLLGLRKQARHDLDLVVGQVQQAAQAVAVQQALVGKQQQEYKDKFGREVAVVSYDGENLDRVAESLAVVKSNLEKEKDLLDQRKQVQDRLHQELSGVMQKLEIGDGRHRFLREQITAVSLSLKDEQDYPYRRPAFTQALLAGLDQARDRTDRQQTVVDQAKRDFERYCSQKLKDEKTRQQSLNGIRLKTTYSEVKEWGEHLQERIRSALTIIEADMRMRDEEVQNFITHLHGHLVRVCEELQTIPKMTAVKIGDRKKEIYDFTVPVWPEQEGQAKLRRHLEWMLKKLEGEEFYNQQGLEDGTRIKKQIENWLHPKQLLQVIDANQEIKVRCRKVNSDSHISSIFTDWPKTEKWSGGEKWSKNMTLFLGILNYLTEKRYHLRQESGNHRAVILDNPFGKASSDHVLAPVFFIAGQLGFQLLALTAHSEGKFLRDHFPIIYSCRLRPTKDPSIAVMTKEKEIHRAYFRDLDPYVMERLGEEEQLVLF